MELQVAILNGDYYASISQFIKRLFKYFFIPGGCALQVKGLVKKY